MAQKTSIEWTATVNPDGTVTPGSTWNPVRGCSRTSPGCLNCYAETIAARFSDESQPFHLFASRAPQPHWTGKVGIVERHLNDPMHWKKPRKVFVNSMSDLFHEDLTISDQERVFRVMLSAPQHTYQILTKRSGNLAWRVPIIMNRIFGLHWTMPNFIWLGVSVENQEYANKRIPHLLRTPAAIRFVSYEPALGPVDFTSIPMCMEDNEPTREQIDGTFGLDYVRHGAPGINQIIVGGESGPGSRPFDIAWARNTITQCRDAGVACFVKQLGAHPVGNGNAPNLVGVFAGARSEDPKYDLLIRSRKGSSMEEWPRDLQVREFPRC